MQESRAERVRLILALPAGKIRQRHLTQYLEDEDLALYRTLLVEALNDKTYEITTLAMDLYASVQSPETLTQHVENLIRGEEIISQPIKDPRLKRRAEMLLFLLRAEIAEREYLGADSVDSLFRWVVEYVDYVHHVEDIATLRAVCLGTVNKERFLSQIPLPEPSKLREFLVYDHIPVVFYSF